MNILFFVQLITEFLPISSSGHVEFFKQQFKNLPDLKWELDFIAHFPAFIVSIIIFYPFIFKFFLRNDLKRIVKDFFLISIATIIPVTLFIFKKKYLIYFAFLKVPFYYSLFITAFILFMTKDYLIEEYEQKKLKKEYITFFDAIFIGFIQSIAIFFPGISRFGITLIGTLSRNLSAQYAITLTTILGCIFQLCGTFLGLLNLILKKQLIVTLFDFNLAEVIFLIFSIFFAIIWYLTILNAYKKNTLWYLGFYVLIIAMKSYLI